MSSVKDAQLRSPLKEAQMLLPNQAKRVKKEPLGHLSLTSLVDTFSIILIYLLLQKPGTESTLELKRVENLPTAVKLEALHAGTIIRVEGNQYFIGENPVTVGELATRLQQVKQAETGDLAEALIIQADKRSDFSDLTPVIRAGSLAGFSKFRFAVLQEEEG